MWSDGSLEISMKSMMRNLSSLSPKAYFDNLKLCSEKLDQYQRTDQR